MDSACICKSAACPAQGAKALHYTCPEHGQILKHADGRVTLHKMIVETRGK